MRTHTTPRALALCAAALLALVTAAAPAAASPPDSAQAAECARLVAEANRKVRQHDLAGALDLLKRAIAADPGNVDAHVRRQDLVVADYGIAKLQGEYADAAKKQPDDPVMQFLATRLLPAAQAAEDYQRQVKAFPASPWPCAGLARALEDLGRPADAALAHADAIKRAGADAPRFEAYRAYGYERTGQWDPAAESWKAVLKAAPADLAARYGLAECLRKGGHPDESLAALDDAARIAGTDPEVPYRRALVHIDTNRFDEALKCLDEAIAKDRSMLEAYCAAAEAARYNACFVADKEGRDLEAKDFDASVGYAEHAVTVAGDGDGANAYAYYTLGAANEAQGEYDDVRLDDALKAYDKALEKLPIPGPEKVRVLTAKSWVLILKESWDGALEAAQRAIDIDRSCVVAYGHAGYALAGAGKTKDAVDKYYRPGLKIDPACARLQHDLGMALWELKKPNDARKPLEEARNLEPDNGRYHLSLGELHYQAKRHKEAFAELSKAAELLPRRFDAWRSFGRAAYAVKNWAECVRAYEKVCELDERAVDDHLVLAVVYSEQIKDKAKAKVHAQKFREKGGQDANLDDWLSGLLGADTK